MITLYVYELIESGLSREIAGQLRAKPKEAVEVRINSPGGDAFEAITIFNVLQSHGAPVTCVVEGLAFSAATIIACAGRCVAYETAAFGYHSPWGQTAGVAEEMRNAAAALEQITANVLNIYAQKTGRTVEEIKPLLKNGTRGETWMSADEAQQWGFVDEIIPGKTAKLNTGHLKLPARFLMAANTETTTPQATATPVMLSADTIVTMCAQEPGIVASLLSKPHTEAQVQARLADAKEIRAMARLSHQSGPAVDAMIAAGVSPDTAGPQLLRMVAEQDAALPVSNIHTGNVVGFGGYGGDHFMKAATDALVVRMGGKVKDPHPAVRDFQDASLSGMAALCLNASGHSTFGRSRAQIIKMAMTTSDFPDLLANTANKSLTTRFEAMTEHRQLCETATLVDFKTASAVNLSFMPGLQEKKEGGEIKYGSLSDGAESYKLATYARGLVLTREALINDDLNAFGAITANAANSAARLERDLVFGVLTANSAMSDSVALFHANHSNLDSNAHGVDIAGLNAARVLMRKQQDSSGGYVLTDPRFIVCPFALEADAEALTASLTYRPGSNTELQTPAWVKSLAVVSDPRLDAASASVWYLLSNPLVAPVIRLGYLNGATSPAVEQEGDFDTDVMKFKIRFDVCAAAVGWAGGVKMA